jgi:hypothetical protein
MAPTAVTRFAHTEGRVSLVYGWDGEKVYTLGMDGEMRVWAGIEDDDCESHLVGDEGFALAVSGNRQVRHSFLACFWPSRIRIH